MVLRLLSGRRVAWWCAFVVAYGPTSAAEQHNSPPAIATEALCVIGPGMRLNRFEVEIADDDRERARGLMFRRQMAEDRGMLFWHDRERPVAMWMKNTYIPLDMLFIDRSGRVVSIAARTVPHSEKIIRSGAPVSAVLELNAGLAEARELRVGDKVLHRYFGGACPAP